MADTSTIGGTLGNLQQVDATHYTATFTGTPGTNISNAVVSVAAGSWQESWGNFGTGGSTASFTVDTIAPQVRMAIDNSDLNLARPTGTVTFLFSQAPVSFTLANTTVSGGTLSNLQLVGSTFGLTENTATFTAAANTDTGTPNGSQARRAGAGMRLTAISERPEAPGASRSIRWRRRWRWPRTTPSSTRRTR